MLMVRFWIKFRWSDDIIQIGPHNEISRVLAALWILKSRRHQGTGVIADGRQINDDFLTLNGDKGNPSFTEV